jgi:hypothetical protein
VQQALRVLIPSNSIQEVGAEHIQQGIGSPEMLIRTLLVSVQIRVEIETGEDPCLVVVYAAFDSVFSLTTELHKHQ